MMPSRHLVPLLLIGTLSISLAALAPASSPAARPASGTPVPDAALQALRQGRYLRASLILRDYLAATRDTTPGALLLSAQAEAGWGDWERVNRLLAGRDWLDSLAAGHGWNLLGRSRLALGQYQESSQDLKRYLSIAVDATPHERGVTELRRAAALAQAGDGEAAAASYDQAEGLLPQIEDWIDIRAASVAADGGDTVAVNRRLAKLDADLMRDWGWEIRVRGLQNAGDLDGAGTAARWGTLHLASRSRQAEAWTVLGQLRLSSADTVGAKAAFLRAISTASGSAAAVDAARALSDLADLSAPDRLSIGKVYLRHGNLQRGAAGIEAYLDAGLGTGAERTRLHYDLGNAYFRAARYRQAEAEFRHVKPPAASAALAADALFLTGRAQYRDGRKTLAMKTFLSVPDRYRGQAAAARALYLAADLYHDAGDLAHASALFRRTIAVGGDIEEVGLARMRLADIAFGQGQYARAADEFEAYRRAYPNGRRYDQATYWAALAELRLGHDTVAHQRLQAVRDRNPFSYYGIRAAARLGVSFWDIPLAVSPETDARYQSDSEAALARVDLLHELDWDAAAQYELQRVKRRLARNDDARYSLAEALNARGLTVSGIGLGWEIFRQEGAWNARLLRIIYPFPYRDIILAEARDRGVDPFLAAGLIRQESMFRAAAVSSAGAVGLMQVLPGTGRQLARRLRIRRFDADMLKRPELNVHLGMMFLGNLLDDYHGRLVDVLAAYNAGPTRMDRWKTLPEHRSPELFTERIPFGETRDYVKIVQQNAKLYAALYGADVERAKPAE